VPETTPLAAFLRTRREQLQPADVGLNDSGRRRTPGLRREEVATLAGISIDYLIRIEQGRDTHPSASVLRALADALQLGDAERMHLHQLAARTSSHEMCPATPDLDSATPAATARLIAAFGDTPAYAVGPLGDVLEANDAWGRLVEPLGLAVGTNLVRHTFFDPAARASFPDWDAVADAQVAQLRFSAEMWGGHDRQVDLLAELSTAPEFASRWSSHAVAAQLDMPLRIHHPELGELFFSHQTLSQTELWVRLEVWLPDDDATVAALRQLQARTTPTSPARLRVVGED